MDNILKPYSTYREAGTEPSFERRINDNYRAGHISPETRAEVEPYLSKEILLAADPPNEFIDYGPRY